MRTLRWSAAVLGVVTALLAPLSTARADDEGTDAPVLGEEQVFERWLRSGREVAAWRAQVGAARFDVVTAKLLPNPELSVNVNGLATGAPPDGKFGYQAQITVPLPIFGQIGARRDAAEALLTVAEVNALGTIWQRAADLQAEMISQAFADARVEMLDRNLVELARLHRIIEARFQAGANSAYDELRVRTAETTVRAARSTAITERTAAEARLLALAADPSLTRARITKASLVSFRGPDSEAALIGVAMQRRPDLELARRSGAAAGLAATRWKREAVPIPSVFAAGYVVHGPFGVQITGGVSLPLPLFDRNQGQIGRALSEAQANELLAQALTVRIENEVRGAWRAREAARAALTDFQRASLPAATELLQRAEVTYQAGKFSVADLFDAYRGMWDARLQELELERQMAAAEADLERAAVLLPLPRHATGTAPATTSASSSSKE